MNKILLILFLCFGLLYACKQESGPNNEIDNLKSAFQKDPTPELAMQLMTSIKKYTSEHKEDIDKNAELNRDLAEILVSQGQVSEAVHILKESIKNEFNAAHTPDNILYLSVLYDQKLNDFAQSAVLKQAFVQRFPDNPKSGQILKTMKGDELPLDTLLSQLGHKVYELTDQGFNRALAADFVEVCENYAMVLNEDDKSVKYLLEAATTAKNMGSFQKALDIFRWIYTKFPNHPKAAFAQFLEAFTYDSDLKNIEMAKAGYTKFIKNNPENEYADDAQALLNNLGKTDEEILKMLEDKQ